MPELPEVETARRGIRPYLVDQTITAFTIRERRLRWPVSRAVDRALPGRRIESVERRAKYLLINTDTGTAMIHLGMSGSVYVIPIGTPAGLHDHFDIQLSSGEMLRYRDPRRFGSLHFTKNVATHKLIKNLGPEPLSDVFDGDYLHTLSRGRRVAIKQFIMNANIVVGVGNIYASEALFRAGIHPKRRAGRVSQGRYELLAQSIKDVLSDAIDAGGTTLRDFYGGDGEAGYFQQQLSVYGRDDEGCDRCGDRIRIAVLGQRSTFYCNGCQT
ncbi:MAG: bifunctional DNA-formamidopyrimidine glycosylase/DNA-(apurinic or apyrimidinic site) lyase [Pseudomonadota bacterium]